MINAENLDFKYLMENQRALNKDARVNKTADKMLEYDFKIVSFRIGQEYYGIDIMRIKEILKEKDFTRIPNALDFVIGVLNLRGEIMPVINLATMFHLESELSGQKNEIKSIIIIKVENLLLGLVVDQIQHVIPLRKNDIQPPSPLLGSINERYIEGVVELNNKLYVILDVESIFSDKGKSKKDILPQASDLTEEFFRFFCNQIEEFLGVHIHDINKVKFRQLYDEYAKENNIRETPNINKSIAEDILNKYYSKHTGELWQQPYVDQFLDAVTPKLNKFCSDEVRVLDLGCANGHEAFSIYFMLSNDFKESEVKMVAADINLNAITNASGFEVTGSMMPSWIGKEKYFMNISDDLYKIKKEINDKIYFEFHNAQNISTYKKEFDIIIARDLSLDLSENDYKQFIKDVATKITSGGLLIVGDSEDLGAIPDFTKSQDKHINVYIKK
jgi:chemotaxis signal transduction protein/chemotaxis methyl-accepting protein methylase